MIAAAVFIIIAIIDLFAEIGKGGDDDNGNGSSTNFLAVLLDIVLIVFWGVSGFLSIKIRGGVMKRSQI